MSPRRTWGALPGGSLALAIAATAAVVYACGTERKTAQAGHDAGHDAESWKLLQAEYASLRDESSQARQAQQSTIAWSLAAFATVFAGGLIFVANAFKPGTAPNGIAIAFYALVFGAALPGFVLAACLTYLGELIRMERAGGYMRGLECHLATKAPFSADRLQGAPLRWETYLVQQAQQDGVSRRKQRVGYVGGAGLYAGAEILSLAAFLAGSFNHTFALHDAAWDRAALVWAVAFLVAFFCVTISVGRSILASGKKSAKYNSITPEELAQ